MRDPLRPLPPLLPSLRERRPIGFAGHCATAFADAITVTVGGFVLLIPVAVVGYAVPNLDIPAAVADLTVASLLLLYTATEIVFSASPGKWLSSVRIRDRTGAPAPLRRRALRWLIKSFPLLLVTAGIAVRAGYALLHPGQPYQADRSVASLVGSIDSVGMLSVYALIAGVFLSIGPTRRPLHDHLAGTAVFHVHDLTTDPESLAGGFEIQPATAAQSPPPADA